MVTQNGISQNNQQFKNDNIKTNADYSGLSTDSKPTGVGNGSSFAEMDTGKLYFYDAQNDTWRQWGA